MRFLSNQNTWLAAFIVLSGAMAIDGDAVGTQPPTPTQATNVRPLPSGSLDPVRNDFATPNSPGAIAIGMAEGTRTIDGGITSAYAGHTDPGNAAANIGSFSCQPSTCQSRSPERADAELLAKRLQPEIEKLIVSHPQFSRLEAWVYADLLVQAPLAAKAFKEEYTATDRARGFDGIVDARVRAFHNGGKLDAPGFGNSLSALRADQTRRTRALATKMLETP